MNSNILMFWLPGHCCKNSHLSWLLSGLFEAVPQRYLRSCLPGLKSSESLPNKTSFSTFRLCVFFQSTATRRHSEGDGKGKGWLNCLALTCRKMTNEQVIIKEKNTDFLRQHEPMNAWKAEKLPISQIFAKWEFPAIWIFCLIDLNQIWITHLKKKGNQQHLILIE